MHRAAASYGPPVQLFLNLRYYTRRDDKLTELMS